MKIFSLLSRTAALAGLAAVSAGVANAQGINVSFVGASPGNGTNGAPVGQYVWDYHLDLTEDTGIRSQEPSSVTFYDFSGITGASFVKATTGAFAAVPGDTFISDLQLTGITPPDVSPLFGDNPLMNNAVYSYSGAVFTDAPNAAFIPLGEALIASTIGTTSGNFVGVTSGSLDSQFGNRHDETGATEGPNAAPAGTPEPGTWAMLFGMGVSGAAFVRRRNRRK